MMPGRRILPCLKMTIAAVATVIRAIPMTLSACVAPAKALTIDQHRWLLKPIRWWGGLFAIGQRMDLIWAWEHRHFTAVFMTTTAVTTTVTIKLGQLIWMLIGNAGTSNCRFPNTIIHSQIIRP